MLVLVHAERETYLEQYQEIVACNELVLMAMTNLCYENTSD